MMRLSATKPDCTDGHIFLGHDPKNLDTAEPA
jgi:hypothetical protein